MTTRYSTLLTVLALGCAAQTEPAPAEGNEPDADRDAAAEQSDGKNDASNCTDYLEVLDCVTDQGYEGNQYCDIDEDGYVLTECVMNQSTTGTPIVLVFDDEPVSYTRATGHFDLFGLGKPVRSAWVDAETPWLALDRDGNGRIDDGSELFGSLTELANGTRASHGFEALAELDANGDGLITDHDPGFIALRIWSDRNQDRTSTPDELLEPAALGLLALELDYDDEPRCRPEGCERERARFFFQDEAGVKVGTLVDVHLSGSY